MAEGSEWSSTNFRRKHHEPVFLRKIETDDIQGNSRENRDCKRSRRWRPRETRHLLPLRIQIRHRVTQVAHLANTNSQRPEEPVVQALRRRATFSCVHYEEDDWPLDGRGVFGCHATYSAI